MGICEVKVNTKNNSLNYQINIEKDEIIKQGKISTHAEPTTKKELDDLYSYESAICKIEFETIKDGKKVNGVGTGFFCEINNINIPFNKALFTNNHVLNEKSIENNEEIKFEYLKEKKKILIKENRKKFTNEKLDYTCIEILDIDKINKFFKIDETIFDDKKSLKEKEIFILQFPKGGDISNSLGIITEVENTIIRHSASTNYGSSGSPLIRRYNNILVLGIHFGIKSINEENEINVATPFDVIIKDIKNQLFDKNLKTINDNKIIEFRNIINLIYDKNIKKYDYFHNNIFGSKFVENNEENIKLIINGQESKLKEKYDLKEGINNIKLIIINKLTNLEYMFADCKSLKNIEELKYLNTKEVNNFSHLFYGCSSLSDIKGLQNWDVSNGNDFSYMLGGCSSLLNINCLENWNVSNGKNFSHMLYKCSLLLDINGLLNWNVSNGKNFSHMFYGCSTLSDIKGVQNWNVSNGKNFSHMFRECSSLSDIKALENWNVVNGTNFSHIFRRCSLLSDIKALLNWNVKNGNNFSGMFEGCLTLSDIKALENWIVSNGKDFSNMFDGCLGLSDISSLKNWNISKGNNFSDMFYGCSSISDIKKKEFFSGTKILDMPI